jgi:hypothetical protein
MKGWVVAIALGVAVVVAGGATAASLIDSGDIKNRSIKPKDLSAKTISKLRGNRGPRGLRGPEGPPGIASTTIVEMPPLTLQPGQTSFEASGENAARTSAVCPAGSVLVGSGFDGGIGDTYLVFPVGTAVGGFFYNNTSIDYEVSVFAICAELESGTRGFSSRSDMRKIEERFRKMEAGVR